MLTVNPSPSSLPRSHPHLRRTLPAHLSSHHHRRRSLSHPAPSPSQAGTRPGGDLRPHAEDEDAAEDEDEEEDDDDEIGVQAESRERLSAFVLKETSGESSDDEEEDELGEGEDDEDSSSSASSSGFTPVLKPADNTVSSASKRSVTFHHVAHPPAPSVLPPSAASPVHRKLVKPSIRQHKASPHHYSNHPSSNKPYAIRLHRRKPHTAESAVVLLPDDTLQNDALQNETVAAAASTAALNVAPADAIEKSTPLVSSSSASRYALLVAILRRSDGRDKLIRTAYFGSNHLRALVHVIYTQLSNNKRLLAMLTISSSSAAPSLIRILNVAASFCQGVDAHLGRLSEVLGAARQLLRFGRWVYDLQSLSEAWQEWKRCASNVDEQPCDERQVERATAMLELINAFLSVLIDLLDDVEWLAEHRILPATLSQPAGLASATLWLTTVCIDIPFTLHTLWALRAAQQAGKAAERRAEQLSLVRYVGDLVYSGCLIGLVGDGEGVRWRLGDSGGLVSAVVSLYKLSRSETLHRSMH